MRPIIRVENLSKQYRLGTKQASYATLRESLTNAVTAPFRRFRSTPHSALRTPHSEDNHFWALNDVSFDVMPGEVVGIIGRNGAGKSTLLKVLSRITEPTKGKVKLYGRVGSLLEVGTGFHAELSGRENIYLNGAILGMKRHEIERKFDEIVAFAEVEQFLDTPVKHYSSGMYMRLAFSVAAHLDPEVLIIDEVLAVGDAEFQKKCLNKMGDVAKAGRTVLFVSHNMNAVEELCSSVILIHKGKVVEKGNKVSEVINHHLFRTSGESLSHVWTNEGGALENPWFYPRTFLLTDEEGGSIAMPVRSDKEVWVQIDGTVDTPDPAMNIGYALFSEQGQLLYWSLTTDEAEPAWPKFKKGEYRLRSQIPFKLLNEGEYRLELIASLHFRQWIVQPSVNAPSISLSIRGGLSESPYWLAKRPGLLGPTISWHSQSVSK